MKNNMTQKGCFLKALGRISVNFQILEASITFFIWNLIGSDQNIGKIITSQVSFSKNCNLLSSLFRYRVQDTIKIKELNNILKRVGEAEQRRNTIIHSIWTINDEDPKAKPLRIKITSNRKAGLNMQTEDIEAEELNKIANLFSELVDDLIIFMEKAKKKGYINYPVLPCIKQ